MNHKKRFSHAIAIFLSTFLFTNAIQAEERQADHDELRAMLQTGTEALNTGNFDLMAPLLHEHFTIITVDAKKFSSLNDFKSYWQSIFDGEDSLLKSMEAKPEADELTYFLDEDTGIVHGTSQETYHFTDGDVRVMKTLWSAVVQKDNEGWKLVSLHFSTNLLDNPVLTALKEYTTVIAIVAFGVGLVLGIIVMVIVRKGRKKATQPAHA